MIGQKLKLVVSAIAASVAWMGCKPAAQPPEGNQSARPGVQEKGGPKVVRFKRADDDLIRIRLLTVEAVQRDLGLTADQNRELKDLVKIAQARMREVRKLDFRRFSVA